MQFPFSHMRRKIFALSRFFQSLVWFMRETSSCERRNKICSVTQLIQFWSVYPLCTSVCSSVEMTPFCRGETVWLHLTFGEMPEVPYTDVACKRSVDWAERFHQGVVVSNCSAGILSSEARMAADKLRLPLWEQISQVEVTCLILKKKGVVDFSPHSSSLPTLLLWLIDYCHEITPVFYVSWEGSNVLYVNVFGC